MAILAIAVEGEHSTEATMDAPLPPELIMKVMKHLDWKDIICMRKVSKRFFAISKEKSVWVDLLNREQSRISPPLHLEQPLGTYSSEEIEKLVLRFKSTEKGWIKSDSAPARERDLLCDVGVSIYKLHLLKGGRWLIVTSNGGSVSYCDLDADTLALRELVPPYAERKYILQEFAVDINSTASSLSFRIALSLYSDNSPIEALILQIFQVNLLIGENERPIGLACSLISSFKLNPPRRPKLLSLLGEHVAFSHSPTGSRVYKLIVIDWVSRNVIVDDEDQELEWKLIESIHLLPKEQILVVSTAGTILCGYGSRYNSLSALSWRNGSALVKTIWSTHREVLISPPFISGDEVRMLSYDGTIRKLALSTRPYHRYAGPAILHDFQVIPGKSVDPDYPPVSGYNRGVALRSQGLILFSVNWERPENKIHANKKPTFLTKSLRHTRDYDERKICIDEGSGRVVLVSKDGQRLTVVDLALIYV